MANIIKSIVDKEQFLELFNTYFNGRDVYVKTKSGHLLVQYLGYAEENVAFRIPRVKTIPDTVIAFTRHENNTVYVSLKFIENKEDTFIFLPHKFQLISEERKESRHSLDINNKESRSIIYMTNITTDYIIKNAMSASEKKIDQIRESLLADLQKRFDRVKIVMLHEAINDFRMKYFAGTVRPIFIPDMKEPEEKYKNDTHHYINNIYANDYVLSKQKDIISEATVPIIYKNLISCGYVQANNTRPMTEGYLSVIKKVATMITEYFNKANIFDVSSAKFLVYDISKRGLGIVFKDRILTRFFRAGSFVVFELILPDNKKATVGAIVKNVVFQEGLIKAGFEIKEMDAISEVHFDEYIDSLSSG